MKYFIYCRKSSEEESKQVQSLETQERSLLDYATKNNLQIVDVIKESKSAKTDGNRPLFTSMLERIRSKEASGLLVLHTDRLSRNGIESGEIIKLFEAGLLQEIRTPNRIYNSISDMLYIDFDFVFASHYSRNLSVRVKEGNATKLSKGEHIGNVGLGYVNKEGKIYPDPTKARYVVKAFKLYNTGNYSLKQIAETLFSEGLRTKKANNKVHKSTLHAIFKNPLYYGALKRNGILYKGIHKPLITKALFDKVNDRLEGKNRSKKQTHDFLYRKYLSCATCNCKITASLKKGKYRYYYCTNGKGKCTEHKKYIPESKMEKLFKKFISDFTLKKEMADLSLDLYIEDYKKEFADKITTKVVIKKQIEQVDKRLDKLLNLYLDGGIDKETYKDKQKPLKTEKTELEITLSQTKEESLDTTLELLYEFKNRACSLIDLFNCKDKLVKEDVLNSLLWNLTIEKQKVASIQYKLPYAYLQNLNKTDDIEVWRRVQDLNL